jgi:hypothetical protein
MITQQKQRVRTRHTENGSKPKEPKERLRPTSFAALPEEIERWTQAAKALDRSYAWYIRSRLLELDKRDEELAARAAEPADGKTA